jgi:hypothetical protein
MGLAGLRCASSALPDVLILDCRSGAFAFRALDELGAAVAVDIGLRVPRRVGLGGRSDLRGGEGDQLAGESSAGQALGHSMGTRTRALERRPSVLPGHGLPGQTGVIGGCAKSSRGRMRVLRQADRQVETTRVDGN